MSGVTHDLVMPTTAAEVCGCGHLAAEHYGPDAVLSCTVCEGPARPVEDREPVPQSEAFERGRQQGDADRAQRLNGIEMVTNSWAQDAAADHFRRGRAIGASEREAELLDQGWTPPDAITVDARIEALKAQVKRRDGAIQRYEEALTEATRSRTRPACNVEAGMTLGSPCACGHLVGIHDRITPGGPIECGPCKAEAAFEQVHTLEATSGPTDYEVWRDALTLAVNRIGSTGQDRNDERILEAASFFRDKLINYPTISPDEADQAADDQIRRIDAAEAIAAVQSDPPCTDEHPCKNCTDQ